MAERKRLRELRDCRSCGSIFLSGYHTQCRKCRGAVDQDDNKNAYLPVADQIKEASRVVREEGFVSRVRDTKTGELVAHKSWTEEDCRARAGMVRKAEPYEFPCVMRSGGIDGSTIHVPVIADATESVD